MTYTLNVSRAYFAITFANIDSTDKDWIFNVLEDLSAASAFFSYETRFAEATQFIAFKLKSAPSKTASIALAEVARLIT